ncbi:hypothetical protein [Burkholderia cepacia]|uniref:hypothetical protein n=1 Tax=Burkholderia cepacia TaxID=292 RepID=UPI000AD7BA70|nr:hypothetical protein [Burkholderia cepacia]
MLKRSNFKVQSWIVFLSFLGLGTYVQDSAAELLFNLETASVVNGYRSCRWQDNGDGTSMLSMVVDFKEGFNAQDGGLFRSRGFLVYTYDKNGNMNPSAAGAIIWLDGQTHMSSYTGNGYVMYFGHSSGGRDYWVRRYPFSADVQIKINNSSIKDWPAISVRAGNYTSRNDIGEVAGAAYFSPANNSPDCSLVEPEAPPPPTINISMRAPDWNLGELDEGTADKILPNSTDQLCFTHEAAAVVRKKFVINASNANGIVNQKYRMKNLSDATQFVPYSVKLNRTDLESSSVVLPNTTSLSLEFNDRVGAGVNKTCFTPTFTTTVDKNVKAGDYSDVLTFTVVTKP